MKVPGPHGAHPREIRTLNAHAWPGAGILLAGLAAPAGTAERAWDHASEPGLLRLLRDLVRGAREHPPRGQSRRGASARAIGAWADGHGVGGDWQRVMGTDTSRAARDGSSLDGSPRWTTAVPATLARRTLGAASLDWLWNRCAREWENACGSRDVRVGQAGDPWPTG